jgi:hypothetical protein
MLPNFQQNTPTNIKKESELLEPSTSLKSKLKVMY